ncbi:amidohydrolase family protein [Jannaschia sp. LMIT008]|uniref:amidohydrolase family protein n=1 Tax=Jannaschia maritima TaxID=3032585 RepID=UPI002811DD68|nr:amidohydrolase family protein [Jannaschia sp. LMIT008]
MTGHVDAHHHVWAPSDDAIGYGWLRDRGAPKPFGDPTPIQRDYLWAEFLADARQPAASVHVQADNAADPLAEVAFAARGARAVGHAVGIVGLCDLSAPDVGDRLAALSEWPELRGIRQIVAVHPDRPRLTFAPRDLLAEAGWRGGLAAVAAAGLSFDLQMYPHQATAALDALAPLPGLRVVVNHALCPVDGPDAAWRDAVAAMAARPDTFVKLSGWGMYDTGWTAASIAPMVEILLDAFGSERTMFGSNYPVEALARPYPDVLACTRAAVEAAGGDVDAVMAGTARRVYGLPA